VLSLEHVSKSFSLSAFGRGAFPAVRDVSFSIERGEVTSLIGESGSGKSTIGKMILRLLSVSSGSIRFEGRDVAGLKGRALKEYYRNVQGVFQDPFSSYNPIFRADRVFSVLHKEYFAHLSAAEWRAKVDASLEAVGLNPPDVRDKFTHQLSGGQLQRLLIARALLLEIKLLVADELISMLDASTRVDVLNLLGELKRRGLGILFITHDLSLGNYISERTIILRRGVVLEMGATDQVFGDPRHPYTRMLLASVPQLHSRWRPLAGVEPAGALVGDAPAAVAGGAGPDGLRSEPARWSKSAEHPLRERASSPAPRRGPAEAVDLAGQAGQAGQAGVVGDRHEGGPHERRDSYLRAHEPVPELVEVSRDHFVAADALR
jgi:peptide/nickel transport system ATP-binding protein